MKKLRFFLVLLVTASAVVLSTPIEAKFGLGDIIKGAKEAVGVGNELSESKIVEGLKARATNRSRSAAANRVLSFGMPARLTQRIQMRAEA